MSGEPRIFLLFLVLPGRWGHWLTFFLLATLLLTLFSLAGAFSGEEGSSRGVALFFIAVLSYIIPVFSAMIHRATECKAAIDGITPGEFELPNLDRRSLGWQGAVLAAGLLFGSIHMTLLYLTGNLEGADNPLVTRMVATGTYIVWLVLTVVTTALIETAYAFNDAAKRVEVNLMNTRGLRPFAVIAMSFALAMIGAQAALTLMFLEGFSLSGFLPGWLALFVTMLFLMALPVWPVHRAIVAAKQAEVTRINAAIEAAPVDETDPVQKAAIVGPLLQYRREILEVPEWPFDLGFVARIGLYLLIPPVTWVGAALIEILVDTAISG